MTGPAEIIDDSDRGDEIIRRFRFQITYAALMAISLTDPSSMAACIYCEQFEDVLIELKDGSYIGVQVKSRRLDQPPFKTTDEQILGALAKFCREDVQFPGHFCGFRLATNHYFYTGDGADDLRVLVECAKTNPSLTGLPKNSSIKKTIKIIAERAAVTQHQVVVMLAKLELEAMQTGIDLDLNVVQAFSEIEANQNLPYVQLVMAMGLLQQRVWGASSKAHQFKQIQACAVTLDIQARTQALTLANKRLTAQDVHTCVISATTVSVTFTQELLVIRNYIRRDGKPFGFSIMEAKMSAGEFTVMELEQYKDDVRSLEAAFLRWKEKFDLGEANARLQHLEQLTIRQCRKHHDSSLAPPSFAHPIVTDRPALAASLKVLAQSEAPNLFGCRSEHLHGAVGILTEECRVWWSEPFDLQGKS